MDASARRSFHVGRYHCVEALACGSVGSPLGETFRAKVYGVAGLEKQYALKQIDANLRIEPERRARLVEAARRWATLEHPHIARLIEIHDEGDELYLVSELARGIDMPRLLAHLRGRGESLPVEQAILVAVDIAEALAAGQRAGVLHVGLVPATVNILGEGEVRVADFALAGALERDGWTSDDALVSFLAYTAPERMSGGAATAASDAWALGALAFELCTGAPLYAADSVAALAELRAHGPTWDRLPSRSGLREVLGSVLSDDPTARPSTAEALREAFAGLLGLEIGRARSGLQALVKRALGRALTRTGSFAAVAIPSASMPTLVQDVPSGRPIGHAVPRTLQGLPTTTPLPDPPRAQERAWAPPRKTGSMPVVRADSAWSSSVPKTLSGLGDLLEESTSPHHPDPMELAELPPSASQTGEHSVTRRTDSIFFDEGVTSPHPRAQPGLDERIDALEPSIDLVIDDDDAPSNELTTEHLALGGPTERTMPAVVPPARAVTMELTAESASVSEAEIRLPLVPPAIVAPPPVIVAPPPLFVAPPELIVEADAKKTRPGIWIGALLVIATVTAIVWNDRQPHGPTQPVVIAEPTTPKPEPSPDPKPEPSPKPALLVAGQLSVNTTPPGATVWLDGADKGTTPVTLPLADGTHHVALVLAGMKYVERDLTSAASIDETLVPAKLPAGVAGVGGLKVRCHSTGELRILVDGNDTGLSCPNDARIDVAPGAHQIGLWSPRTGEIHSVAGEVSDDTEHSTRIYVRY
ncbi:MAG: protein kinase [Polyangia bacterium]